MATTPNFGWSTPDNTGLVKNGALDIRTLGNAIDASLLDLKGGTTNQVLAKNSNTDMDFKWVADASGIPATIIDAKGDLIAGTAADTASRLAVGSNGQVLTADSAEATGLKWATPSSGGATFSGVKLQSTGSQLLANNTDTAIIFNIEDFDTDGFHSNTVNNTRITIPAGKAGYYQIGALVDLDNNTSGVRILSIKKNGTSNKNFYSAPSTVYPSATLETILYLAVGDYVELFGTQNSGSSQSFYVDAANGQFYAYFIGA